jgi:hypothetical protein
VRQIVATHAACRLGFLRDWKYVGMEGDTGFKLEVFLPEPGDKKPDPTACAPEPEPEPEPALREFLKKPTKNDDGKWEF